MPLLMRLLSRLVWTLFLICPPLMAQPGKPLVPAKDAAELEQRLGQILSETKVPGLCAVIVNRGGIQWTAALGKADVEAGRAVGPDTLFRIGSISKLFVGLAALKLVEEGRLKLDTPVRSLVPAVAFTNAWEATHPVRVVHLLEHTTGWDDLSLKEFASNDPKPLTLAEGLALGPESRTCRWRPGTRFAYTNSGPAVTAAIIEKLTGQTFEAYVESTFFKPLGMPTADYFNSTRTQGLLTKLYHADGTTPYPYWNLVMRPSGALNASAREMGALLRFLLLRGEGQGQRILSEASLQRMEVPTTSWGAQGGLRRGYGLHNQAVVDDRGVVWHGHGGDVDGGHSDLAYLPEQGVGYFFSINGESGEAFQKIQEQLQAYVARDLPKAILPPVQPIPAELTHDFQGWYMPINPRPEFINFLNRIVGLTRVSVAGNRLQVRGLGLSLNLVNLGGQQFRSEDQAGAGAVLMNTEDGRIMAFGRGAILAKVNPVLAWVKIVCTGLFLMALISIFCFGLVWGCRWLFRRMRGVPNMHVRVLPLLALLSLASLQWILIQCGDDTIERLGHRTIWSVGLCVATWAFAAFSLAALWAALRVDRRGMNRWAYAHSLGVALIFTIVTLYLGYWGVIGLRTWS